MEIEGAMSQESEVDETETLTLSENSVHIVFHTGVPHARLFKVCKCFKIFSCYKSSNLSSTGTAPDAGKGLRRPQIQIPIS